MLTWIKRHALVFYFLMAMLISWSIELPLVAVAQGWTSARVPFSIHYLASFGPMLSAILTTVVISGKAGLKELFQRIVRWRVGIRWVTFACLSPLALFLLAAGVTFLAIHILRQHGTQNLAGIQKQVL